MSKRTLLIDFDGVLARWNGQWSHMLGEPLPRARHAMHILSRDFNLVCFTTRPWEPVDKWLKAHGFPHMKVTDKKEDAHLQIDDRAMRFDGDWNDSLINDIKTFTPHWKDEV